MTIKAIYNTPDLHGECFVKPLKKWDKLTDGHLTGVWKIGYVVHGILGLIAGIGMLVKCASTMWFRPDHEASWGLVFWKTWLQMPRGLKPEAQYPKHVPGLVEVETAPRVMRAQNFQADSDEIVRVMNRIKQTHPYRTIYIQFGVHDGNQTADVKLFVAEN